MLQSNIDIETFYKRNKLTIDIVCSFVGNKWTRQLITYCRLKPYSIFNGSFHRNKLQKIWVDEFGNSIEFSNGGGFTKLKDERLIKNTLISTDLFCKLALPSVVSISNSVIISEDYFLFFGKDEYFRAFTNKKEIASPLLIGASNILNIIPYIRSREKYFEDKYAIYSLPNKEIELMIGKKNE